MVSIVVHAAVACEEDDEKAKIDHNHLIRRLNEDYWNEKPEYETQGKGKIMFFNALARLGWAIGDTNHETKEVKVPAFYKVPGSVGYSKNKTHDKPENYI